MRLNPSWLLILFLILDASSLIHKIIIGEEVMNVNKLIKEYRRLEKLIKATDGHLSDSVVSELFGMVGATEMKALGMRKEHKNLYNESNLKNKYKILQHYIQQYLENEKERRVKLSEHSQVAAVSELENRAKEIHDKIFISPKLLFHVVKGNTYKNIVLHYKDDVFSTYRSLIYKIFTELKDVNKVSTAQMSLFP